MEEMKLRVWTVAEYRDQIAKLNGPTLPLPSVPSNPPSSPSPARRSPSWDIEYDDDL